MWPSTHPSVFSITLNLNQPASQPSSQQHIHPPNPLARYQPHKSPHTPKHPANNITTSPLTHPPHFCIHLAIFGHSLPQSRSSNGLETPRLSQTPRTHRKGGSLLSLPNSYFTVPVRASLLSLSLCVCTTSLPLSCSHPITASRVPISMQAANPPLHRSASHRALTKRGWVNPACTICCVCRDVM
jgi:hypothetical protein